MFLIGDGAEFGTRYVVSAFGGDKDTEEVIGSSVGLGSYAAIGAVAGGPVGAAVGVGVYGASRLVGAAIDGVFSLFRS
jgi:hypothetical protein